MLGMDITGAMCALVLWSLLSGLCVIAAYLYSTWNYDTFDKRGIKGPRPWPLIGTMGQIFFKTAAELDLERAKEFGKVYGIYNGRKPSLVIGDANLLRDITVKDFNSFVDHAPMFSSFPKPLSGALLGITGDHWKHVRSTLSPTFTTGKLKLMMDAINNCGQSLTTHLVKRAGQPAKVKDLMSAFMMDVIAATTFGIELKSLEDPHNPFVVHATEFVSVANRKSFKLALALMALLISPKLSALLNKVGISMFSQASISYMEMIVHSALKARSADENRKDFLQLCKDHMVDIDTVDKESVRVTKGNVWTTQGLTADDVLANALVVLTAGYDTTSTFLTQFCYAMAIYPHIQDKVYSEVKAAFEDDPVTYESLKGLPYLDWCVDETLRMYPPLLRTDRVCTNASVIGGIPVRAGESVIIPIYPLHHDADYWTDPYVFRPERFSPGEKDKLHPYAYMPFGTGPRGCIGMRLALFEAKAALVNILSKFRLCTCTGTPEHPLKWTGALGLLIPKDPIVLSFQQRT